MHAGEPGSYTICKKNEDAAVVGQSDLNYARRTREAHIPASGFARKNVSEFVNKALAGKYKDDKEGFEQKKYECIENLRDNLGEINQHTVSTWISSPVLFHWAAYFRQTPRTDLPRR